jgi:hypothetical protein
MGLRFNRSSDSAGLKGIHKFRRRFAKLLIAIGLIYIGAAFSAAQPRQLSATQKFTLTPASSSGAQLLGNSDKSAAATKNTSVLGQNTSLPDSSSYPTVFVPQCTYQPIPYRTVYKTASWLNSGQTTTTGGIDGEQRICTTESGVPAVTTIISPFDKTVTTGTYVPYSGYINSDGDYVPSPDYSGGTVDGYSPTALCSDGTYSYSQHASGTCSSHGGVSSWL